MRICPRVSITYKMASASFSGFGFAQPIEKLYGIENYAQWATAMEAFLRLEKLWTVIEPDQEAAEGTSVQISDCRSQLILYVEQDALIHFNKTDHPKDIWKDLKSAFEDKSRLRRHRLLRQLCRTDLAHCATPEEYVAKIIMAARQLQGLGMKLEDDFLADILLMGLPEMFEPMVMGMENSGIKLSTSIVEAKILTDVKNRLNECRQNNTQVHGFYSGGSFQRRDNRQNSRGNGRSNYSNNTNYATHNNKGNF